MVMPADLAADDAAGGSRPMSRGHCPLGATTFLLFCSGQHQGHDRLLAW